MTATKNTPPRALHQSFGHAWVDAITAEASNVITGLDALSELCNAGVDEALNGAQVLWFAKHLRGQMLKILDLTDFHAPEFQKVQHVGK